MISLLVFVMAPYLYLVLYQAILNLKTLKTCFRELNSPQMNQTNLLKH